MTRFLAPALLAASLVGAGAAMADDDDCRSAMSQWQSRDDAVQHAADLGIAVRRLKIDDGCYEVKGRDGDGNTVELTLNPASLALKELEVKFRAGSDPSRYIEGARGSAPITREAPGSNPLFEQGSKPQFNRN